MTIDDPTLWTLVAETKEFVGPISVTADGDPVTTFEVTVTAPGVRPVEWSDPTMIDGDLGVLVGAGTDFALTPGIKYTVWIRFTDTPEIPVRRVGFVRAI